MKELLYVRVRRNGAEVVLKVQEDKLQQVMDAANRHFGAPGKDIGGPSIKSAPGSDEGRDASPRGRKGRTGRAVDRG